MPLFRRPTQAPPPLEDEEERIFPQKSTDYELLTVIGEGASSTVWLARCVPHNVRVAVKIIDTETPVFGKVLNFEDIRKEVHFWSSSKQRNIAPLYTTFISKTHVWFIMKYMPAGSCQSILQTAFPHGFEEDIVVRILYEVLQALQYFHKNSHIHRDIKAGNILIDDKGIVQVTDFGVAGDLIEGILQFQFILGGLRREVKTSFVGTPCWMAPEVILGKEQGYDTKADIWSLGITGIELATGRAPQINMKPMKIMVSRVQDPSPKLPKIPGKSFSTSLQDFIKQCLIKDPEERPGADELLNHRVFKSIRNSHELLQKSLINLLPPVDRRADQTVSKKQKLFKTKHNQHVLNPKPSSTTTESVEAQSAVPQGTASGRIYGVSKWNFGDQLKNEIQAEQSTPPPQIHNNLSTTETSTTTSDQTDTSPQKPPITSGSGSTSEVLNSRFIIEVDEDDEQTDEAIDVPPPASTNDTSQNTESAAVGTLIDLG